MFMNPGEADHYQIIWRAHRIVVTRYKRDRPSKYKIDMPKPILLAIDDDTSVLEAVVQDLRRHYGQDYRIVRAASGAAALDICRQLNERKDTVALFLSDQRMPGMTGVDFLQQALTIYPDAKRVLPPADAVVHLKGRGRDDSKLPVVVVGDGTSLVQPASNDLATKLRMPRQAQQSCDDIVVVGAVPAGLAAGVYAASEGLGTLIVEGEAIGGQAGSSSRIENYLGFPQGLSGADLADRAHIPANRLCAEVLAPHATSIPPA